MTFNFKSGKPVQQPKEPTVELHAPHGRLPDEFHNVQYEKTHPEQIQPVHYDNYDPKVEGFFGAGYNFEPMEREHHLTYIHHPEGTFYQGASHFTPGVFGTSDLE